MPWMLLFGSIVDFFAIYSSYIHSNKMAQGQYSAIYGMGGKHGKDFHITCERSHH